MGTISIRFSWLRFALLPGLLAGFLALSLPVAAQEPSDGTGVANPAADYTLDHFKCYAAKGESVDDLAFLRDQFAARDRTFERDTVTAPEAFCNTTRKVHGDGGAGISDLRNHLTWYRIKPVFKEDFKPRDVLAFNQFAPNGQKLTVRKPEFLAVPTQKRVVDDRPTDLEFPAALDHFKCYTVAGDFQPVPVQLQDQFDRLDGGPNAFQDARVLRPRYLCNPTDKVHFLGFGPDGTPRWNNVRVQHPKQHLVCYEIQTRQGKSHTVLARNQFGPEQKLPTGKPQLLCAPSEKREPQPNSLVTAGFAELNRHISGLPEDILNQGQRNGLLKTLDKSQGDYQGGDLCGATRSMDTYLNQTQALRKKAGAKPSNDQLAAVAEDLFNRGHRLRLSFFDVFDDVFFDIFVRPSPCFDQAAGREPSVNVRASDNTRFAARVSFGSPLLWTAGGGGETWTQLALPGIENLVRAPGLPSVPTWQGLVAIPVGAEAVIGQGKPQVGQRMQLNLYPFQPQAVDQGLPPDEDTEIPPPQFFADPPFVKNERATLPTPSSRPIPALSVPWDNTGTSR